MKKIISIIIMLLMFVSTVQAVDFKDTENHWAKNTINRLANLGIVNGVSDTEFNPNGVITRAEYLKMMMNFVNVETTPYRYGECLDAVNSDWYAEYLQSALDKGLIPKEMIASYKVSIQTATDDNGKIISKAVYSGAFNGGLPIEREEMAAITMNLYQYSLDSYMVKGMGGTEKSDFTDTNDISVWALPGVKLAVSSGFIQGMEDGSFKPRETATRAQAATIIGRILDKEEL